jgi:polyisoprenoid-binding protein YceI
VTARVASAILAAVFVACGGAATPTAAPPQTAVATSTPAGTVSASGPWTFDVDASSKTTVRVREVLAQVRVPGDALLTATGMKGGFTLNGDGSFSAGSKLTADLTTLKSDQSRRDDFIKGDTLETRRFPTAQFVPTKATGLALPLPVSADMKFTLAGKMTIHGVTRDVTFAVTARRDGAKLTATAVAEPAWKFADFGMTVPRVASVLSIEDDIRVEIALVATETA